MRFILPLLFLSFTQAQDLYESFESFDKVSKNWYVAKTTFEFDVDKATGNNRVVEFQRVTGDITIEGQPTSTVTIVEKIEIKARSQSNAKKVFNDARRPEVSKSGEGHIQFERKRNKRNRSIVGFSYEIIVPTDYNLSMRTSGGDINLKHLMGEAYFKTSGGDIEVLDLTGRLTGKTSGGDFTLEKVEGVANLKTSGGDIVIYHSDGKFEGTTSGGDIEVLNCRAEVDMHTSGGDIEFKDIKGAKIYGRTYGGDIDIEDLKGDIRVYTSGGSIEVDGIQGDFDGETSGGNIEFNRVNGHVDVKVLGGNIIGEMVKGHIFARTSGGRIEIEKIWDRSFDDHEISLNTSGGKIELILPKDFPANIEATIFNRRSSGAIDSEIPLEIKLDDGDMYGNGEVNGGTFSVTLKTSDDTITIEKD